MGNDDAGTASKSEKESTPPQEQSNIQAYPNWAAVQAYYGPGVGMPPPYFNSAVPSGHPPHPYMWGTPQHLMSPYGNPYAAVYPPGGVYAHPSFLGAHSQGLGNPSSPVTSEPMAVAPLNTLTPAKSSSNKDQALIKKLKGLNGSAVSLGNGNSGSSAASHSGDCGTDGSSDGSDENTLERRKRSSEGMTSAGADTPTVYGGETNATSTMVPVVSMVPASMAGTQLAAVPSLNGKARTSATTTPGLALEVLPQDGLSSGQLTKDERELKRERRKQSNRESARRSRLRKQAEAEELAVKVEALNAQNLALRSEIDQLAQNSDKLRLENDSLMGKLKELVGEGEAVSNSAEPQEGASLSTENFLSRVENSLSNTQATQKETETTEQPSSGAKLHQLLESNPRADAVAAS